jgi:surface protein
MNKIYLSGNYVIVEKDGNVYEYPRTLSVYTLEGGNYVIKERIDDGQFVIPIAQIGTYFDEAGAVAYDEATLVAFLRTNTGFKTAGGGSPATEFIMLIKTDNSGTTADNQFAIPTAGTGYNYDVDWGDGTTSTGLTAGTTHTFPSAGNYVVKISGDFPRIYFNLGGDRLKLLEVQNWGNIVWGSDFRNAFAGCSNMNITATDSPDISNTMFISAFLFNCTSLDADLGNWDVSNCTNMAAMFQGATIYQGQGLENWDVSNVTNMSSMFRLSNFDNNIGNWQLNSALPTMDSIFRSGSFPSPANYTDTIVGWANYVFTNGAPFGVNMANQFIKTFDTSRSGGANFATAGDARAYLTSATPTGAGWTISSDTVI